MIISYIQNKNVVQTKISLGRFPTLFIPSNLLLVPFTTPGKAKQSSQLLQSSTSSLLAYHSEVALDFCTTTNRMQSFRSGCINMHQMLLFAVCARYVKSSCHAELISFSKQPRLQSYMILVLVIQLILSFTVMFNLSFKVFVSSSRACKKLFRLVEQYSPLPFPPVPSPCPLPLSPPPVPSPSK